MAKELKYKTHIATGKLPNNKARDMRDITEVSVLPKAVTGERGYSSPKEIPSEEYEKLTVLASQEVLADLKSGNFRRDKLAGGIPIRTFSHLKISEPILSSRKDSNDGLYYPTVRVSAKARGYVTPDQVVQLSKRIYGTKINYNEQPKRNTHIEQFDDIDFSGIDDNGFMLRDDDRFFQVAQNQWLKIQRTTCDIRGEHPGAKFRERNGF